MNCCYYVSYKNIYIYYACNKSWEIPKNPRKSSMKSRYLATMYSRGVGKSGCNWCVSHTDTYSWWTTTHLTKHVVVTTILTIYMHTCMSLYNYIVCIIIIIIILCVHKQCTCGVHPCYVLSYLPRPIHSWNQLVALGQGQSYNWNWNSNKSDIIQLRSIKSMKPQERFMHMINGKQKYKVLNNTGNVNINRN
jgi:hypothetical protein